MNNFWNQAISNLEQLNQFELLSYENLPNNTSFPAAGFDGILRASSSETTAIPAPAKKTKEGE